MNKLLKLSSLIILSSCTCGLIPTSFWYVTNSDNIEIVFRIKELNTNLIIALPAQTYGCDGRNFIGHIRMDSNNTNFISIRFDSLLLYIEKQKNEAEILFITDKAFSYVQTQGYLKDTNLLFEPYHKRSIKDPDYAIIYKNVQHYWKSKANLKGAYKVYKENTLIEQNTFNITLQKSCYRAILPLN